MPRNRAYKVGYKKPPKETQFQAGNRAARPLQPGQPLKDFAQALARMYDGQVTVTRQGKQEKARVREVIARKCINRALSGNEHNILYIIDMVADLVTEPRTNATMEATNSEEAAKVYQEMVSGRLRIEPKTKPKNRSGISGEVGYGRPPVHSRFRQGQSGNPRGRPKTPKTLRQFLLKVLNESVDIVIDGKKKSVSKLRAVAINLIKGAMTGDARRIATLEKSRRRPGIKPLPKVNNIPRDPNEASRIYQKMIKGEIELIAG